MAPAASRDATMSVSSTEKKFEEENWATANTTPPTTAGSHVCRSPRRPSTRNTRTSGTKRARIGVCLPTIDDRSPTGTPVILARVVIGTAMAPNATGAVLATSATVAAFSGLKPRAISITELIATGVPNPASASIKPPKQNAMMMAWTRWSLDTVPKERRSTSKCPVSTVMV